MLLKLPPPQIECGKKTLLQTLPYNYIRLDLRSGSDLKMYNFCTSDCAYYIRT